MVCIQNTLLCKKKGYKTKLVDFLSILVFCRKSQQDYNRLKRFCANVIIKNKYVILCTHKLLSNINIKTALFINWLQ